MKFFKFRRGEVGCPLGPDSPSFSQKIKKILSDMNVCFRSFYKNVRLPILFDLLRWKSIDLYRSIKYKKDKKPHLYGIYGFFGLPGQGKTMGMSWELSNLRKKYGDDIYIFTNYGFKQEDESFNNWRMLLKEYDKPAIFAWDEVQNEFNSRDFKKFPTELLTLLTQNRKGNGKRIYYTAQRWNRVDKVFRELTIKCAECKTRFGRLTSLKWYHWEEYDALCSQVDVNLRIRIKHLYRNIFVQSDNLRNSYDSYQMLESAKGKEYLDRSEIARLV